MRTQRRGRIGGKTARRAIALLVAAVGAVAFAGEAQAATLDFAPYEQIDLSAGKQGAAGGTAAIADVTGDGKADVLAVAFGTLFVFPQSHHRLGAPQTYALPAETENGEIAVGDFSRDHRPDVAVDTRDGVAVFAQRSDHTLAAAQLVPGTNRPFEVVAHDMNRDGWADLVIASDYGLKVLLSTRNGFVSRLVSQPTFEKLSIADTNGDGRPDIVVSKPYEPYEHLFTQRPDGSYADQRYLVFRDAGTIAADLGGRTALIGSTRDNRPNSVVTVSTLSKTGAAFPVAYGTYDSPDTLAVADMNGDGRRDIVVSHWGWDTVGVLTQNADRTFARERVFLASWGGDQFRNVAVGDIDGDGKPDIVLMDPGGVLSILRRGTGDAYEVGAQSAITGGPTGVVPASQTTATFTFRSNAGHPFFGCYLDGRDNGPCTSPATFRNLAPGPHTFFVRATGADEGPEQFFEARMWSVGDPHMSRPEPPLSPFPPDTTITTAPPAVSDSRDPVFAFTSNETGVTFECALDSDPLANSSWGGCRNGVQGVGLWGGEHTFFVRAVDSTGHADPTPASYTWTINGPHPDDPPPNDDFANARALTSDTSEVGWDNQYATKEPGEPDHAGNPGGHSIWFTWTAPQTAVYRVTTNGGSDTLLGVYTGTSLGALAPVASNDDAGPGDTSSRLDLVTTAGTTYDIAIDTKNGETGGGALLIQWQETLSDPTAPVTVLDGGMMATTASTSATFTFHATDPDDVSSSLSYTCRLDDGPAASCPRAKTFSGLAPGTHTFSVFATDPFGNAGAPDGETWTIAPAAGPTNDDFAHAEELPPHAFGAIFGADTTSATLQAGEPTILDNPGGHSVWFAWTAPAAGPVTFNTHGTRFDTTLAVYTGSSLAGLQKVGENDDSASNDRTSAVTFTAAAGQVYRIQVDGWNGTDHPPWSGPLVLAWETG